MTRFGVRHLFESIGNRLLISDFRFLKWEIPQGGPFATLLLAWDLQDEACLFRVPGSPVFHGPEGAAQQSPGRVRHERSPGSWPS